MERKGFHLICIYLHVQLYLHVHNYVNVLSVMQYLFSSVIKWTEKIYKYPKKYIVLKTYRKYYFRQCYPSACKTDEPLISCS